jgi:hypothetical protein
MAEPYSVSNPNAHSGLCDTLSMWVTQVRLLLVKNWHTKVSTTTLLLCSSPG